MICLIIHLSYINEELHLPVPIFIDIYGYCDGTDTAGGRAGGCGDVVGFHKASFTRHDALLAMCRLHIALNIQNKVTLA